VASSDGSSGDRVHSRRRVLGWAAAVAGLVTGVQVAGASAAPSAPAASTGPIIRGGSHPVGAGAGGGAGQRGDMPFVREAAERLVNRPGFGGRWARVPASSASPLVCASNTVRTCVQRIRSTSQCLQVGDLRRSAMTYPGLPGSPDRLSMSGCGASIREAWRTEPFHNPTPCRGWDQRSSCAVRSSLSRHHGATQPGGTARTAPARPTSLSSGEERKPCRP
jgi:hypothetical protein